MAHTAHFLTFNTMDNKTEVFTFNRMNKAFTEVSRSVGLITKGKSYMSEEKRIKARKKRKKKK